MSRNVEKASQAVLAFGLSFKRYKSTKKTGNDANAYLNKLENVPVDIGISKTAIPKNK
jgi:hypothetical protein